jgi:hypothetical protein
VLKYTLHRMALAIPTLFIVAVIVFLLMRAIPGDPAQLMLGDLENPRALEQMRRDLGLDKPVVVQFVVWLKRLLVGDLGNSIAQQRPVLEMLSSGFGVTASLVIPAMVIASLLAIPLGMLAAWRQNTIADAAIVTAAIVFLSIPSFWLGLIFLLVFGLKLDLLPVVGYVSIFENFWEGIRYLLMPVTALALIENRRHHPHGALEHDRSAAPRIHHARTRQGARGAHRRETACAEERDGAHLDHDRPRARLPPRRCCRDGDGLHAPRHRAAPRGQHLRA